MALDPIVAIQFSTIVLLSVFFIVALLYYFRRADYIKGQLRHISSLITLFVISLIFIILMIAYWSDQADEVFSSFTCKPQSNYAPTTVICTNNSQNRGDAIWSVNGKTVSSNDQTFSFPADDPGQYEVILTVSKNILFSTSSASAKEMIIINKRESVEKNVREQFHVLFDGQFSQRYELKAPINFDVIRQSVSVKLIKHRGEIVITNKEISDSGVVVEVSGQGRFSVTGLKFKKVPAQGSLIIEFKARKRNAI